MLDLSSRWEFSASCPDDLPLRSPSPAVPLWDAGVGPRAGLDRGEKNLLPLPGLEPWLQYLLCYLSQ
jgi:hypothetical protein